MVTIDCADPAACQRIASGLTETVTAVNLAVVASVVAAQIARLARAGTTDKTEGD